MPALLAFALCFLSPLTLHAQKKDRTSALIENAYRQLDVSNYDSAIVCFKKALKLNTLTSESRFELQLELSKAYKINSEFKQALIEIKEAERLAKNSDQWESHAKVYISFMEYYRALANFKKAQFYIDRFEQIPNYKKLPDLILAEYYNRRAAIATEGFSQHQQSIEFSLKALEYARKSGDSNLVATTYNELGYTYDGVNPALALRYYQQALAIWRKQNNHRSIVTVLINIGRFQQAQQNLNASLATLQEAAAICDSFRFESAKSEVYINLYNTYSFKQDYKKALESYLIFRELEIKHEQRAHGKMILDLERKYDFEKQLTISRTERYKAKKAISEGNQKTKQRNNLLVFSALVLVLMLIILYLYIRNRKANRLLMATNEKLEHNLKEKELLYKELHHRVKNNLTLLKGLLYLRANASKDSNVKMALKECEAQIQSMAAIHTRLYTSENVSKIELKEYVQQMGNDLKATAAANNNSFTFEVQSENLETDITAGTLVGLTINELIINSIKHTKFESGQLHIGLEMKQTPDGILFRYTDNGQGLPQEVTLDQGGFGFKLISIMIKQLKTTLVYKRENDCTVFEFKIPQ